MIRHPSALRVLSGLLLAAPLLANACTRPPADDSIAVRRWVPVIKAGEQAAPLRHSMVIGSVHAYLVPQQAEASVHTVRQGMMAPAEILSDGTVEKTKGRFRFTGEAAPAVAPPGKKWVHVHASSFGRSELRLSDPSGWRQVVELGMVYPQPQPQGEPTPLVAASSGEPVSFDVDANRNTLWLSVPGLVNDRWAMAEGADTSFELMRVEQLAVPYGDPPMVGLFLAGGRSLRSGTIRLEKAGTPPKSFRFNVSVRPAPAC